MKHGEEKGMKAKAKKMMKKGKKTLAEMVKKMQSKKS